MINTTPCFPVLLTDCCVATLFGPNMVEGVYFGLATYTNIARLLDSPIHCRDKASVVLSIVSALETSFDKTNTNYAEELGTSSTEVSIVFVAIKPDPRD